MSISPILLYEVARQQHEELLAVAAWERRNRALRKETKAYRNGGSSASDAVTPDAGEPCPAPELANRAII